jgi:hypothetical protein
MGQTMFLEGTSPARVVASPARRRESDERPRAGGSEGEMLPSPGTPHPSGVGGSGDEWDLFGPEVAERPAEGGRGWWEWEWEWEWEWDAE